MSSPLLSAPVVSTQWLADHLGSPNLVVLDATVLLLPSRARKQRWMTGYDQYLSAGHVPGAVFADLIEEFSDPDGGFDFTRPGAPQFERAAASVGVDNDTTVIVYDSAVGQWAARIWWLFRAHGYDNVAVLDGGFGKWTAEERPVSTGHVQARAGRHFTATARPDLWADKTFVESVVAGASEAVLVCSAPKAEFAGEPGARPRAGHIPGSVSIPLGRLVDRTTNAFLGGRELAERVAPAIGARRVVTYCGIGVGAAVSALALVRSGHDDVALYDGSLNEWAADEDAPLAVSA